MHSGRKDTTTLHRAQRRPHMISKIPLLCLLKCVKSISCFSKMHYHKQKQEKTTWKFLLKVVRSYSTIVFFLVNETEIQFLMIDTKIWNYSRRKQKVEYSIYNQLSVWKIKKTSSASKYPLNELNADVMIYSLKNSFSAGVAPPNWLLRQFISNSEFVLCHKSLKKGFKITKFSKQWSCCITGLTLKKLPFKGMSVIIQDSVTMSQPVTHVRLVYLMCWQGDSSIPLCFYGINAAAWSSWAVTHLLYLQVKPDISSILNGFNI